MSVPTGPISLAHSLELLEDKSLRWDTVPDPVSGDEDCLVKIEAEAAYAFLYQDKNVGKVVPP